MALRARRLADRPIAVSGIDPSLGANSNGPSLIATPAWLPGRRARYHLYFAHHQGRRIHLALADAPEGPWRIRPGGALRLEETPFAQNRPAAPQPDWARRAGVDGLYPHIASPDVTLDEAARRLVMWLHGLDRDGIQRSVRALSEDGLRWTVDPRREERPICGFFAITPRSARSAMAGCSTTSDMTAASAPAIRSCRRALADRSLDRP